VSEYSIALNGFFTGLPHFFKKSDGKIQKHNFY